MIWSLNEKSVEEQPPPKTKWSRCAPVYILPYLITAGRQNVVMFCNLLCRQGRIVTNSAL